MNKSVIAIIVIMVIVVGGGGVLLLLRTRSGGTTQTTMNMPSVNTNNAAKPPTQTNSVSIKDFAFNPASITVTKGTTVTWTNNDSTIHTVTESDNQTGPTSGQLAPGQSYSFTFSTTGTFQYHCAIHSSMTGTVIVTE